MLTLYGMCDISLNVQEFEIQILIDRLRLTTNQKGILFDYYEKNLRRYLDESLMNILQYGSIFPQTLIIKTEKEEVAEFAKALDLDEYQYS